jgi:serine phosphatase RsbU (regulator of sigma subunit)
MQEDYVIPKNQNITEQHQLILNAELLEVEKKAQVFVGWLLSGTIVVLNVPAHISRVGDMSDFLFLVLVISALMVLWFSGSALIISKGIYHSSYKYINLVIQVSMVTGLMMASYKMVGVEFALTSIPPMLYLLIIGLCSMTLNPKLSLLTGLLAAIQFMGAYGLWLADDAKLVITEINSITWTDIILKAVIFILMGYTAMIIAMRSRVLLNRVVQQVSYKEQLSSLNMEMSVASDIQNKLIPESNQTTEDFDVEMYYKPALQVGGDYYDVFKRENGSLVVLIADVSGTGYSAALMMSNIQAIFQTLARQDINLKELVILLNRSICSTSVQGKFVSLVVMELDHRRREIGYINCGHNPPIVRQDQKIVELDVATPVLGVLRDYEPIIETISFKQNDVLFAYTDGLSELFAPSGEQLGTEPIKIMLDQNRVGSSAVLIEETLNILSQHMLDEEAHDDISFLCIKHK